MLFNDLPLLKSLSTPDPIDQVRLVHSVRAKRLALRVDPAKGDICLVVPKRSSERAAWKFANQHIDWIKDRLSTMEKPVPYIHGTPIPIFGIPRVIDIEAKEKGASEITLYDDRLHVRTARADPTSNIQQFLKRHLNDIVLPMAREKALRIEKNVSEIQLRNTRTRWGSCSPDGKLMLCWRLVFAPMTTVDYVVAHEVAHLQHMDHSKAFWALARHLSDDFTHGKHWLDLNGDQLMRYGASS